MTQIDIELLAGAIKSQVATFSDRRLNDCGYGLRTREIDLRRAVAATANAICFALHLDTARFAAACGLHVSNGRDIYSDCHPGELTWEAPVAAKAVQS